MKFVAFFRNVNIGQHGCPTRVQLESAFRRAGADSAASFFANGTLVFSSSGAAEAQVIADRARAILQRECKLTEPAFVRSLRQLAGCVARNPFAGSKPGKTEEAYYSCFAPTSPRRMAPPLVSKRRDCVVFRIRSGNAFSISRKIGGKSGYPTPLLESVLKTPVTTRGWTTILRLVAKHST